MSKWLLCSSPLTYMEVWQLTPAQYPFISAHLHCSLYPKQLNVTDRNFFFPYAAFCPYQHISVRAAALHSSFFPKIATEWRCACFFLELMAADMHSQFFVLLPVCFCPLPWIASDICWILHATNHSLTLLYLSWARCLSLSSAWRKKHEMDTSSLLKCWTYG